MQVLVVDDQIHVVDGIVSGIEWGRIGVDRVFKAYSAFEARQVLELEKIDILLCDIEMPTENGLSLYRWTKERELSLECIFLTAHADFAYAQEAVRLGGFDYILQPVRYEEIQSALLRAESRLLAKRELAEYSAYGKTASDNRDLYLDGALQDFFLGKKELTPKLLEALGIYTQAGREAACVLFQFVGEGLTLREWDERVLRYAMNNILGELFAACGWQPLLVRVEEQLYGLVLLGEADAQMDKTLLHSRLLLFCRVLTQKFCLPAACYPGAPVSLADLRRQAVLLLARKADNVAYAQGLFEEGAEKSLPGEDVMLEGKMRRWALMLGGRNALPVREEVHAYLDGLAQGNRLNANSLKRFYQKLVQMLAVAGEQLNIPLQMLDEYLTAYQSVDKVKELVDRLIPYFQTAEPEESGGQLDRILQYIYSHMEDDIRRTDIAQEVFLNPDYLSRLFKKEMGVSLKEFITAEKMKVAKNLLKCTALPIGTVALRVGYTNFSHFSQTYKRSMGVTPEEERK